MCMSLCAWVESEREPSLIYNFTMAETYSAYSNCNFQSLRDVYSVQYAYECCEFNYLSEKTGCAIHNPGIVVPLTLYSALDPISLDTSFCTGSHFTFLFIFHLWTFRVSIGKWARVGLCQSIAISPPPPPNKVTGETKTQFHHRVLQHFFLSFFSNALLTGTSDDDSPQLMLYCVVYQFVCWDVFIPRYHAV